MFAAFVSNADALFGLFGMPEQGNGVIWGFGSFGASRGIISGELSSSEENMEVCGGDRDTLLILLPVDTGSRTISSSVGEGKAAKLGVSEADDTPPAPPGPARP